MTKLVKFNQPSVVHMIPDEIYKEHCDKIHEMKYTKFTDYCNRLKAGSEFEMRQIKLGEILEIPDWYFEAYKDQIVAIGVSFDKYRDKSGQRRAYKMEEALMHGDVQASDTMKKVKVFELVEQHQNDSIKEAVQSKSKRV